MRLNLIAEVLAVVLPLGVSAVTVETAPITVDLRDDAAPRRVVGSTAVAYSAQWVTNAATASTKCVLVKTAHAGTAGQTDTTLADTTEEAAVTLTPDSDGARVFTVTMKAMNGSTVIGSVSREISFGYEEWTATGVRGDTTTNKMQHVVDEGVGKAALLCDTSWVPGAASAVLTQTRTPWLNKRSRGTPIESTLANYPAPHDGAYEKAIPPNEGADYAFSLVFKDGNGNPIGDPYLAGYSNGCTFGLLMLFR